MKVLAPGANTPRRTHCVTMRSYDYFTDLLRSETETEDKVRDLRIWQSGGSLGSSGEGAKIHQPAGHMNGHYIEL